MRLLLASGAVALSLLALGCAEEQAPDIEQSWEVRGVYNGPRFDGDAASVEHEAIPGLMDAMTMDFRLSRPDEIEGLETGDKVAFRLDLVDGLIQATDFAVLPDSTTLDLTPDEMAPSRADLDTAAAPEASGGSAASSDTAAPDAPSPE
ncbi:MAG: copper-binding protein [Bacteroidota bacterium]